MGMRAEAIEAQSFSFDAHVVALLSRTRMSVLRLSSSVLALALAASCFKPEVFADEIDGCADAASPALHVLACTAIIEGDRAPSSKLETAYINRGLAYFATNDLEKAVADFDSAIALSPQDARAYEARAIAYASEHVYEKAAADDKAAIEIDPLSVRAYNNLAIVYKAEGRLVEAIASYDRAISIAPNEPKLYFNRGKCLRAFERTKDAIADYDHAIALDGAFLSAYLARGNAYEALGNVENAKADFDRVLQIDPMNNAAIVNRLELDRLQDSAARANDSSVITTTR